MHPESPTAGGSTREPARVLPLEILPQPDDETCGPTCLHAVYRYWGDEPTLPEVISSARSLNVMGAGRGTLAVMLGIDALRRGYRATLYTFNLQVFDPTWFDPDCFDTSCFIGASQDAHPEHLRDRLRAQAQAKQEDDPRFTVASESYLEFLRLGGRIRLSDPTSEMISEFISSGRPILTGVSATYLYRCAREFGPNDDYDDIRGYPTGHFIVLHGYDDATRMVTIADPLEDNPGFASQRYEVAVSRLVPAIMLGVLTYDANLLVIEPDEGPTNDTTKPTPIQQGTR